MEAATFRYTLKYYRYLLLIFVLLFAESFVPLANASRYDPQLLNLIENADTPEGSSIKTSKIRLNVTVVPVDSAKKPLGFYFNIHSSVWLSDNELRSLMNYAKSGDYVQEFRIFREKLFKRYGSYGFTGSNIKYKFLTILTCVCIQGNAQLYDNHLGDPLNKSISVNIPAYVTKHTQVADWEWLESSLPDLSLLVVLDEAKTRTESKVSLGGEYDASYYENAIFSDKSLVTGDKNVEKVQPSHETELHSEAKDNQKRTSDNLSQVKPSENNLETTNSHHTENNSGTVEPNNVSSQDKSTKVTEESDKETNEETISDVPQDSVPVGQPEVTSEPDMSDTNEKEDNSTPRETGISEEPIPKNKASTTEETDKTVPKAEEYDETLLMDKFEASDGAGTSGVTSPLELTMSIRFYNRNKVESVEVTTKTILLFPVPFFKYCKTGEINSSCAREIRNRLLGRYEDKDSDAFKWGKLISLLQALAFQNSVFVETASFKSEGHSTVTVVKPEFILPFKSLDSISSWFGNAKSTDGSVSLSFNKLDGDFPVLPSSKVAELGMDYGPGLFLTKFTQKYGNLLVTRSKNDLPALDHQKTGHIAPNPPSPVTDHAVNSEKDERGNNFSINELLDEKLDTKQLHNDIHFVLSGYEKALNNVPKRLNGYRLSWSTVRKYPELQNLWVVALDVMKLLKRGNDLKEFLEQHVFSYEQLKDLFEITYGLIASENYNSVRHFYESVGITQEDVDKNLSRVRNLFFARTATSITRLPPVVKEMSQGCPTKDMITSLSSHDLVERLQLMFGAWLKDFRDMNTDNSFELAGLCSASSVLLQQWHYFQVDQKFHEDNVPWISLITSFSRLAKGKYSDSGRKNELKELVNSPAGRICREYINSAGIVASSPYKGAGRNTPPKSLVGAVGNALDQNMESPVEEIVHSMRRYFATEMNKKTVGNSLGICFSLQILYRMNKCLSIERSNDYALYMLNLLTSDTLNILNHYNSVVEQTSPMDIKHDFICKACNPNDPTVNSILDKLFNLLSVESHRLFMEELEKRGFVSPTVKDSGELVTDESEESFEDKDTVDLNDNFMNLQSSFDALDAESLLEIAHSIDEGKHKEVDVPFTESALTTDPFVGSPDFALMENIYGNLMKNHRMIDPRDMKMVHFDIRMEPQHTRKLLSLNVPMLFHIVESEFIKLLKGKELLHMLLYRLAKRIESLEEDIPASEIEKKTLELAKAKNRKAFSIPVEEYIAHSQSDLKTYQNLKNILEKTPEDGFYFEQLDGKQVPEDSIGQHTAKFINKGTGTVVIQLIDPVEDYNIKNLFLSNNHVRSHDQRFYQIFVR